MNLNIVETEYQSSSPIKGMCHEDFQNVAETFFKLFVPIFSKQVNIVPAKNNVFKKKYSHNAS